MKWNEMSNIYIKKEKCIWLSCWKLHRKWNETNWNEIQKNEVEKYIKLSCVQGSLMYLKKVKQNKLKKKTKKKKKKKRRRRKIHKAFFCSRKPFVSWYWVENVIEKEALITVRLLWAEVSPNKRKKGSQVTKSIRGWSPQSHLSREATKITIFTAIHNKNKRRSYLYNRSKIVASTSLQIRLSNESNQHIQNYSDCTKES